jgi:RNA polymerase sigma factor (sigma-70 family)
MASAETALMSRVRRGDRDAFACLVEPHSPALRRFAARQLAGDAHLAEDVVQDAMLNAYRAIAAGATPQNIKAWLFTLVRNCAVNTKRAARATVPLEDHHGPAVSQSTSALLEQREWMDWLMGAIGDLPARQREALLGHAFEGRSYAEIAMLQHTTISAVKTLIHRARRGLAGSVSSPWRSVALPIIAGMRRLGTSFSRRSLAGKAGTKGVLSALVSVLGAATVTTGVLMVIPGTNPGLVIASGFTPRPAVHASVTRGHRHGRADRQQTPWLRPEQRIDHEGARAIAQCLDRGAISGKYSQAGLRYAARHLPGYAAEYTDCRQIIIHAQLKNLTRVRRQAHRRPE